MFDTFMSYLSRFSRLILVTIAVLIVVVLLAFTINSADNSEVVVTDETETTAVVTEENTSAEVETETVKGDVTYDAEAGSEQVVVVNESQSASATTAETANPQLSGGTGINLDSSDSVTVVTLDEEGNITTESGQVSSTSTGVGGVLPSTGLTDVLAAVVGLMVLIGALGFYILSRQNLATIVLDTNR